MDKDGWKAYSQQNQHLQFREYYKKQLKLQPDQFQLFWKTMKRRLPVCFRVNSTYSNTQEFCKKIQKPALSIDDLQPQQIKELQQSSNWPIQQLTKVKKIEWMPTPTFTTKLSKQIIKKNKILQKFHAMLAEATDSGVITRQQLVSTIPPLFLDIKPDHLVLDMCAAPGSKTSQMLQQMSALNGVGIYKGSVIANDADKKRAMMLTHQLLRSGTLGMTVVNHPAQFFPNLKYPDSQDIIKFDRILADVPCSGDGATRKIPNKWFDWTTDEALSLHPLQLNILIRSINLCKQGGRVLYSTCSLNPIEDEAVIAALLKKVQKGSIRIINIHQKYPQIKAQKGLIKWQVLTSKSINKGNITQISKLDLKFQQLFEQHKLGQQYNNKKVKDSMFATQTDDQYNSLRNTMRILPSDMDCGGFFIALIQKRTGFKWLSQIQQENIKQQKKKEQKEQNEIIGQKKKEQQLKTQPKKEKKKSNKSKIYQEYQKLPQSQFQQIAQYYGLPKFLSNYLFINKLHGSQKKVTLVSDSTLLFLHSPKLNLINIGSRAFVKNRQTFAGKQCSYRICQQSLRYLLPFVTKKKINVSLEDFKMIIQRPKFNHNDLRSQLEQLLDKQGHGCIIFELQDSGQGVVCQNFNKSTSLMVSKQDTFGLLLRYQEKDTQLNK